MRRLLLAVALAGAVHALCATELGAQSQLTRGQPVQGRVDRPRPSLLGDEVYVREFMYEARAGETPELHLRADFPGDWSVVAYAPRPGTSALDVSSMASALYRCSGTTPVPTDQSKICRMDAPVGSDTKVRIFLTAERPGNFVLAAYGSRGEGDRRGNELFALSMRGRPRSSTSGLQLSAGYGSVTFEGRHTTVEDGNWEDAGVGPSGRVGLGFGSFTLFAEGQMSRMTTAGEEYTESNGYTLYHADLGSRLYLLGSGSWLRPFVQFAYGIRRLAGPIEEGDAEMEGVVLTPGAGMQLFLTPELSIEGTYRRTSGDFTRIRLVGEEWIDVPEDLYLKGPSNRISAQMVVHF